MHQAESRIGMRGGAQFDAGTVPEVAAAKANYESAQAQARLAAADAGATRIWWPAATCRAAPSIKPHAAGDRRAQANASRQQYEAALNGAHQGFGAVESAQAVLARGARNWRRAEKGLADTTIRAPFDGNITARPVQRVNTLG